MAVPIVSAPVRPRRATAAWSLAAAVFVGSIVCLAVPHTAATEPWTAGLSLLVIVGSSIGLLANISTRYRRRGHMTLARTQPAFVIGTSRLYHVRYIAYVFGWFASTSTTATLTEQPFRTLHMIAVILFGSLVVAAFLALLSRSPRVEIHPGSLRLVWPLFHCDVPWDALGPTAPPTYRGWNQPVIQLNLLRPDRVPAGGIVRRPPKKIFLRAGTIFPPADIAALVDHYVAHPEERHGIGRVEELDRLRAIGLA